MTLPRSFGGGDHLRLTRRSAARRAARFIVEAFAAVLINEWTRRFWINQRSMSFSPRAQLVADQVDDALETSDPAIPAGCC
jgi:hypothetical protein